jgi:protein-tyrosine phosphatase
MTDQRWGLVGAPNCRELGGVVGAGGRRVRQDLLIRTSALGRLLDEDVAILGKVGIACVVDLRDRTEIAVAPPDRLSGDPWGGGGGGGAGDRRHS